jgi:hypothetical protein
VRRGAFPTGDAYGMKPINMRSTAPWRERLSRSAIAYARFTFTMGSDRTVTATNDTHHGYDWTRPRPIIDLEDCQPCPSIHRAGGSPAICSYACLIGVLIGGIAGCAAPVPKLTPPLPAQWQHVVASNPAKPTDLHGWWHAFDDPQLDALVDRALTSNLDVAQAVARLRATRALHDRAHARYLPSLRAHTDDVSRSQRECFVLCRWLRRQLGIRILWPSRRHSTRITGRAGRQHRRPALRSGNPDRRSRTRMDRAAHRTTTGAAAVADQRRSPAPRAVAANSPAPAIGSTRRSGSGASGSRTIHSRVGGAAASRQRQRAALGRIARSEPPGPDVVATRHATGAGCMATGQCPCRSIAHTSRNCARRGGCAASRW